MKQTFKIVVAIIILVTLLGGNISVFAAGVETIVQEQNNQSNVSTPAPSTEPETATPDTDKDGESASEEQKATKAEKRNSENAKAEETTNEDEENNQEETEAMLMSTSDVLEENAGIGNLEVKIDLRLPKNNAGNKDFTVKLIRQTDKTEISPVETDDETQQASDQQLIYKFENLVAGEVNGKYQLRISGKGYKTFETAEGAITVKADSTTHLELTNGYDLYKQLQANESNNKYGIGLVRVGDVDNNGSINDDDIRTLIEKIESGDHSVTDGKNYDFNNDGVFDIVDLSYVAVNKGEEYKGPAEKYIAYFSAEGVSDKIEEAQGTVVKDELDETAAESLVELIGNEDKHLSVQPANPEEAIGEENPVVIGLDLSSATTETKADHITIAPSQKAENNITKGTITVEGENSERQTVTIDCEIEESQGVAKVKEIGKYAAVSRTDVPMAVEETTRGTAKIEADGSITVDFGDKIAVKKVVIKATGTKGGTALADIAKVEFLNGMENKIPAPQLTAPNLKKDAINESVNEDGFKVIWDSVPNVTGYVVVVRATIDGKEIRREYEVDGYEYELLQFGVDGSSDKSIKDLMSSGTPAENESFTSYWVSVYAVNGEWKGQVSEEYAVTPKPTSVPQPVTGVTAKGGYKSITVTWDKDNRASDYFVYCKKHSDSDWILASPETDGEDLVSDGNGGFKLGTVKKGITETSYTISQLNGKELESLETYDVKVIARNAVGRSADSTVSSAKTLDVQEVELPNYKRINTSNGHGELSEHITNIWYQSDGIKRSIKDSPLDVNEQGQSIQHETNKSLYSAKGLADNNYSSYFECTDWDAGGFYDADDKCIVVEFDKPYKMNYVTLAKVQWDGSFQNATIRYKNESGKTNNRVRASLVAQRVDKNGAKYTAIKFAEPVTTDRLVIGVGGGGRITIAEMAFYNYDTIEDEINALFNLKQDPSYLTLSDDIKAMDVNAALTKVDAIEAKLDTPDTTTNEINPEADSLRKELELARDLINDKDIGKVTNVNSTMSTWYDTYSGDNKKNIEFKGSLNAWQPLGVVGRSGEEITVYVGNPYKATGESTRLNLVCTQWRATAGTWMATKIPLKVGANTINVPQIITENRERGGSLYVEYTGLKEDDPTRYIDREYSVRVSGGTEIPVLDLSSQEVIRDNYAGADRVALTEQEKKSRIEAYINELSELVPNLEQKHNEECKTLNKEDYPVQEYKDGTNPVGSDCLLTVTEIVFDGMMYSVSSNQIWQGLEEAGYSTNAEKATGLENSITAMEDMLELFYNQKGLSKEGTAGAEYAHTFPRTRQNIRCMRMTGKAFMYAGGLHIGIQWNEVKDLAKGVPFEVDMLGKITKAGNYFGWGIAHEIGHVINQQAYVHGEVTNNYFSILAQTDSTRDTVRFKYEDVYAKVTSGKTGKAQNVFTQLGLYWQLHLAYDTSGYSYMKLDTPSKQQENSIFARMDTYARDTSKAPTGKEKQVSLSLTDSKDDNLMRLACAATQKNLLDFFVKWGMEPNDETKEYASQFPTETRAIQYVNDEASTYRLEGGMPIYDMEDDDLTAEITNVGENNIIKENKVTFNLGVPENNKAGLLGYEIVRTYQVRDGIEMKDVTRPVAFVEGDQTTYTDVISSINNRVFTYKVVAYDKYLNKVAEKTLEPVKVSHKGEIDKSGWQVTTNASSATDKTVINDPDNAIVDTSDENQVISGVSALADNDYNKAFDAELKPVVDEEGNEGETPENIEITIELPETKKLVGLKYTASKQIEDYEIRVSNDKDIPTEDWTIVRTSKSNKYSNFDGTSETLYFTKVEDGKQEVYNYDYDCTYVKFIIHDTSISINELDLLGQSGDNVEFREGEAAVGILESSYTYDSRGEYIPENSIVFTGKYVGNPAYNVVLLWYKSKDSDEWKIVDGYQIILAKDPGEANLGETDDGDWVYVVEPKEIDENGDATDKDNPFYTELQKGGEVRAQLFRVDDAQSLAGERLVSDTLDLTLPDEFNSITLTGTKEY